MGYNNGECVWGGYTLIRVCIMSGGVVCSQNKGLERSGNVCSMALPSPTWRRSQIWERDSVGGNPATGTHQQMSEALLSRGGICDSAALTRQSTFLSASIISPLFQGGCTQSLAFFLYLEAPSHCVKTFVL